MDKVIAMLMLMRGMSFPLLNAHGMMCDTTPYRLIDWWRPSVSWIMCPSSLL
jgi:hypothetical protein